METSRLRTVEGQFHNVADKSMGTRRTSPTALDYDLTFLRIDDDTDSDREINLDPSGTHSPAALEDIRKRRSASTKSNHDTIPSILTLELPRHVLVKLKDWVEGLASNTIWIEGTSSFTYRSRNALPRWRHCQNTPIVPPRCIFASCDPRHTSPTGSQPYESGSKAEHALLSLLNSIIAQLQGVFPSLSFNQLDLLDRSKRSAEIALQMMRTFLEDERMPSLFWIIDGLQFAEGTSKNLSLMDLVYSLRVRRYKICFTTQETSEVLSKVIYEHEHVNASMP